MTIATQKFVRKPLYVDAVRVTNANFDEIAAWCQGEILQDNVPGQGSSKKYIKVRVHNPKNPRQTKAFVGDWLLYTERGYKVYTNKAFYASFDSAQPFNEAVDELRVENGMPPEEGVVTQPVPIENVTAAEVEEARFERAAPEHHNPEIYAHSVGPVVANPDPETGVQPILAVGEPQTHMTPQGEPIEVVEATPQAIADVVNEQQPTVPVDDGVEVADSSTAPPVEADGRRVISVEEQAQMDRDELKELLKSGEVVLAQDLAA